MGWKRGEVGDLEHVVANLAGRFTHLLMRVPQQLLQKTKFMDQLQRGRMNGVATKTAQKVGVLFEDNNTHTRASQHETKHHSSRAADDDAASRIDSCVDRFHFASPPYMYGGYLGPIRSALYTGDSLRLSRSCLRLKTF